MRRVRAGFYGTVATEGSSSVNLWRVNIFTAFFMHQDRNLVVRAAH